MNDVESMVFGLVLAVFFALWMVAGFRWWWRGRPLLEKQRQSESPLGFVDLAVIFGIWLSAQMAAVGVLTAISFAEGEPTLEITSSPLLIALGAGSQLVTFAIAVAYLKLRFPTFSIFGITSTNLAELVVVGVGAFFMWIPLVWFIQTVTSRLVKYQHETIDLLRERGDLVVVLTAWIAAVLIAPIVEEFFFRGVFQAWMQRISPLRKNESQLWILGGAAPGRDRRVVNEREDGTEESEETEIYSASPKEPVTERGSTPWVAIAVSSVVFGMAHIGQGLAAIPLTVFGLCLGYMYARTGSILPCIVTHMMLNGLTMSLLTFGLMTQS